MLAFFIGLSEALGINVHDLPAEVASRGWTVSSCPSYGMAFRRYEALDILPIEQGIPRDPCHPRVLADLTHWMPLLRMVMGIRDHLRLSQLPGAHLARPLYPEEGKMRYFTEYDRPVQWDN